MSTLRDTIVCWSMAVAALQASQSPTGDCPDGRCRLSPPAAANEAGQQFSADVDTRAVARVVNVVRSGRAIGSGTLVAAANGRGLVVTCAHLLRDGAGTLQVTFPRQGEYPAQLLKVDMPADLAALEIADPGIPPIAVSETSARPGDPVVSCGYGSDGQLWCNRGQALGYVTTIGAGAVETLELSGSARFGDSGGPVLDRRGQLVAVLYGTDGRVVDGTYCGRVRRFLADVVPRFCKPPAQIARPSVEPAPALTPVAPSQPADPHLVELNRIAAAIQQSWQSLSAKLDSIAASVQQVLRNRESDSATLAPPQVQLPPGVEPIGEPGGSLIDAAQPWLVARLTALLVSVGVPGGLAGMVAGGVVYLAMRRGQARLKAELARLKQSRRPGDSDVADGADDVDRAVVERHHNQYVPYEITQLDKAWASAHAHVGEKYPGAIPYLKMVEGVKDQLLSGLRDSQTL